MAKQHINVGTTPNDGLGDPIRTSYIKCNDNFDELYSMSGASGPKIANGTSNVNISTFDGNVSVGINGTSNVIIIDAAGLYIAGNLTVSGNAILTGNILGDRIQNGTTTIDIQTPNGNANISVSGISNIVVFASTGEYVNGVISATGNITGGNILGGNLATGGTASATGNITGGNVSGTNLTGSLATAAQANITSVGTLSSLSVSGNITSSVGNLSMGNVLTGGLISATGNITGGNVLGGANVNATTHTGTTVSVTGNITGGNVLGGANVNATTHTGTTVSVTGNITGGNVLGGANVNATTHTGATVSVTGNITGSYFVGNGSLLTGITVSSGTYITNGTSNVDVGASGNVTVSVGGTSNVAVFATTGEYVTGVISATGNITGGNVLGGANVNATTHTGTTVSVTGNITGGNVSATNLTGSLATAAQANITSVGTLTSLSVTGNITGGNVLGGANVNATTHTGTTVSVTGNITGGNVSATNLTGSLATAAQANITSVGTLTSLSVTGNITGGNVLGGANVNATTHTGTTVSVTGNITGGNVTTAGILTVNSGNAVTAIVNGGSNAVGNIGSATVYFNQIFAQATTALYADLAEMYTADNSYEPGTVISFGGTKEVTISQQDLDPKIAGVISSNPAYLMNSGLVGEHIATIALTGRVSCMVYGNVTKGDMMVSAGNGRARAELNPTMGTVIGKSLEDFTGELGLIEVVVGRL